MSDVIVAFDDFIHGTGSFYSSSFFNSLLGELECFALQAVADNVSGGATATITVQLETSGDGRNWANKNGAVELSLGVASGAQGTAIGHDINIHPGLALARLRVDVASLGTPGIKLQVSVRPRADRNFTPARIPGCRLWLRSDIGITLAAGGAVSRWEDQSGNGNHATQSTGSQQPTFSSWSSSFNGLPALSFDGSNDLLATPSFALGVYTVMMVCTGQNGTNRYFWTRSLSGANADTLYGTTTNTTEVTRGASLSAYDDTASWGQWGATTAKVLIKRFDGTHAGHTVRMNATAIATSSVSSNEPGTATTNHAFVIAARDDGFLPADIDVAEVAVFNQAVSTADLLALEEYARRRYGLY